MEDSSEEKNMHYSAYVGLLPRRFGECGSIQTFFDYTSVVMDSLKYSKILILIPLLV